MNNKRPDELKEKMYEIVDPQCKVKAIGYDQATATLYVTFRNIDSGEELETWAHREVSYQVYAGMYGDKCPGAFYHRKVLGLYERYVCVSELPGVGIYKAWWK